MTTLDDGEDHERGPLSYQESKKFHGELFLCNVYDNTKRRYVTFEIYGLDTQETLHLGYDYAAYDGLFRFNAELMNPNRKEGRFHWTIERLGINTQSQDRKLQLKPEPTEEVPELPIYETTRKIPTGRMDLKERQRLREQMDMLDVKRAENIAKRRRATKQRFLKHIMNLKEEYKRKQAEVEEKIAEERLQRYKAKEEMERRTLAEDEDAAHKAEVRRKAADNKETGQEEKDEQAYKELRERWKVRDREKEKQLADLQRERDKTREMKCELVRKKQQGRDETKKEPIIGLLSYQENTVLRSTAVGGRIFLIDPRIAKFYSAPGIKEEKIVTGLALDVLAHYIDREDLERQRGEKWALRDGSIRRKQAAKLQSVLEVMAEMKRQARMQRERNQEFIKLLHAERQPIFEAQLKRTNDRKVAQIAEAEATSKFVEKRAIPVKAKTKGSNSKGAKAAKAAAPAAKKPSKEASGGEQLDAKGAGQVLDNVEAKMRKQMEEQQKNEKLELKRNKRIQDKHEARHEKENTRAGGYREGIRKREYQIEQTATERRLQLDAKKEEAQLNETRRQTDAERRQRVREENWAKAEKAQIERLAAAAV